MTWSKGANLSFFDRGKRHKRGSSGVDSDGVDSDGSWGMGNSNGSIRDMTRASRRQFVGIDEKSTVGIARVIRQHSVVDILLGTFGSVARSQKPTGRIRGQTGFQTSGLSVVVMSITVIFRHMLQNDPPEAFDVQSAKNFDVIDLAGAQITFRSNPVTGVIRTGSFGSSGVVIVVKRGFLRSHDFFDQIIGGLIGNIGIFLQENGVLTDLVGDFVFGVFGVVQAEGDVGVKSTCGRGFGITVSVMRGRGMMGGVMWHWMVRYRMNRAMVGVGGKCQGNWQSQESLKKKM